MPDTALFAIDVDGASEIRQPAWDFKDFPEVMGGDNLVSSPSPLIEYTPASPPLTIGTPVITGTQVQALVSITNGVVGSIYETTCSAYTASGKRLICRGDLILVGPS